MLSSVGDYTIVEELGAGAWGTVYLGRDPEGGLAALKVLHSHLTREAGARARFLEEARNMQRLDHPNIARVLDVGEEDGTLYFAMQFVQGRPLSEVIRASGPMAPDRAAHVVAQIADALDHAHSRDIIHRDVKPANILLTDDDTAVMTDFGIARVGLGRGLTTSGGIVCTPDYMSPEQGTDNPLDGRSDIYSLGVVLFELIAGRAPFISPTPIQAMRAHTEQHPPDVRSLQPNCPDWLATIVARCLAKQPYDRFRTGSELALALRNRQVVALPPPPHLPGAGRETVTAPAPPQPPVHPTPPKRSPSTNGLVVALIVCAVLLVALVAGFAVYKLSSDGQTQPDELVENYIPPSPAVEPAEEEAEPVEQTPEPPPPMIVTVPDVVGMYESDATTRLRNAGLIAQVKDSVFDDLPKGTVIRQRPACEAQATEDDTVALTISKGPDPIPLIALEPYYDRDEGFRIEKPVGWTLELNGPDKDGYHEIRWNSPDGRARALVGKAPYDGGQTPMQEWSDRDEDFAHRLGRRYQKLALHSTTLSGMPAAHWEFVYSDPGGKKLHKIDVLTHIDGVGWAVLVQAPPDEFGRYEGLFARIIDSFEVL